jgi:hypothetical protein
VIVRFPYRSPGWPQTESLRTTNKRNLPQQEEERLATICSCSAPVLQRVAFPYRPLFAGSLSGTHSFDARCPVLHSDLFPEFPCDSELIPLEAPPFATFLTLTTGPDQPYGCAERATRTCTFSGPHRSPVKQHPDRRGQDLEFRECKSGDT